MKQRPYRIFDVNDSRPCIIYSNTKPRILRQEYSVTFSFFICLCFSPLLLRVHFIHFLFFSFYFFTSLNMSFLISLFTIIICLCFFTDEFFFKGVFLYIFLSFCGSSPDTDSIYFCTTSIHFCPRVLYLHVTCPSVIVKGTITFN